MKNIIGTIRRGGGKTASYLLAAIFALAAAQSAWAAVIDMGGSTNSTTNLGTYKYNNVAIKNNTLTNGTLNVTGNQYFADGTFTFGSGLVLNQTNEQWGVSGARTVKIVDGCVVNHTSGNDIYFGRYKDGSTWKSYNSNATQLILDNGVLNSDAELLFQPIANNNSKAKSHTINFVMTSGSALTLDASNGKELRIGQVTVGDSQKVTYLKLTAAITNSTITARQIRIGDKSNSTINQQADSFNNITFGPGTVLNVGQVYSYAYPAPTVVFDGVKLCWLAGNNRDDSLIGQNDGVTTRIYTIGPNGLVIDKSASTDSVRTSVSDMASALSGTGGITKTGDGTITWNTARIGSSTTNPMTFTGPLVVSNGTWTSTLGYAASAFRADGGTLVLSGALSAANVALAATEGGTLTLTGATITDVSPDMTLAGGGTTDYFTRDSAVGTYALDSLTLGEGAVLNLDADATTIDAINATTTSITATSANPATVNINFTAAPAAGATFTFFETDSADKFTVVPKLGNIVIPSEVSVVDGVLTLTVTADNYTWNGTGTNWDDAGAWTKNDAPADWSDGNNAIFGTANATATLAANAAASEVRFTADATVSGSATLTAAKVNVAEGVTGTISAPTSGTFEKTGAGTLTLGANRTDQTTLSEGTLAMANGATVDPANLTLGTDAAKPVIFDYGGQTLTKDPAVYLGAGMDVTLTNGTFTHTANVAFTDSKLPATFTIATNAILSSTGRFTFNSETERTINFKGATLSTSGNNYLQNSGAGKLTLNFTEGATLATSGRYYAATFHEGQSLNAGATPELYIRFDNSSANISGNGICLGCYSDRNSRNLPVVPVCELSVVNNSSFASPWGIGIGESVARNPRNSGKNAGRYVMAVTNSTVTTKNIHVYADRHNYVVFNGAKVVLPADSTNQGILAADDDYETVWSGFIPYIVDGNGLEIDTAAHNGTVSANLGGSGPVTKTGAGTLTITKNQTSTAALNVNAGTVAVDGGVTVARPVTVKDAATITVNATSQATVNTLTLDAGSTLNIASYAGSAAALSVTTLALPDSGTVALTLNGGAFPVGTYKILDKAGIAVAAVEGKLVPSTGSETAVYSIDGSTLVLTVGTPVHCRWIGANGGNFADPGSWSDGQVPVAGEALDFSGVTGNITINCGDLSGTSFAGVNLGSANRRITVSGTLRLATMSVEKEGVNFSVASDSKLIVDGDVTLTTTENQYLYIVYESNGRVEIGGKVVVSGKAKGYSCYKCSEGSVIALGGVENSSTQDRFKFNARESNAKKPRLIVGKDGFVGGSGASAYWVDVSGSGTGAILQPADSDFVIGGTDIGLRNAVEFDTTDTNGVGRTVTIDATVYRLSGSMKVSGTGTLKINYDTTTKSNGSSQERFNGAVTVTNTATLAINAGKVATTGVITVYTNASLQVAESGTVTLGGGLTLKEGTQLGFNYTTRDAPVLNLTDNTVTFDEGETTNVVVKISADGNMRPRSGLNVLTSGGKFAGVTVSLDETNKPDWVQSVSVENGDIVIDVKPLGTMFIVW